MSRAGDYRGVCRNRIYLLEDLGEHLGYVRVYRGKVLMRSHPGNCSAFLCTKRPLYRATVGGAGQRFLQWWYCKRHATNYADRHDLTLSALERGGRSD